MAEETNPTEHLLTKEQKEYVAKWITDKGGSPVRPCPVCNARQWVVGSHIVAPLRIEGGGVAIGGTLYPSVPLICGNCGNTHFMNIVVMRLPDGEKHDD